MIAHVLTVLGVFMVFNFASNLVHPPEDVASQVKIFLRLLHFFAGVMWIGMLYFFNVVNVPTMKVLDAPTKGKVIPELIPRALWWFRWGAVFTVLSGLTYYSMYILASDVNNANNINNAGYNTWGMLGAWLLIVLVTFAIIYFLVQPKTGALNKGAVLAVIIAILMLLMITANLYVLGKPDISNKSLSIAAGGGMGIVMFLNVWLIIWPAQKKIIGWTRENAVNGTPIPPESAKLARTAFLASRTNFWLSIPMLFFMAASHDYAIFGS
jgi:uncharacterized membrane protein